MGNPFKTKLSDLWRRHLRPILIIVLVFTTFRSAIADWNDVPTGSMKPTIIEGDRIFVNKLAYGLKIPFTTVHLARWSRPQRGEIVIFYSPEGVRLVKRVVGISGDRIQLKGNQVFINGQRLDYKEQPNSAGPALFTEFLGNHPHTVAVYSPHTTSANTDEIVVPPGEYFMLGDNRDNSKDSRYFGTVKESEIVGRASRVVFSLDYEDHYLPRGNRFFKPLP